MRPQVLDEIKQREVLAVLAFGVSRNAAAAYVGCAPNTLRNAMRRDETFRAGVLAAERNCETQCLQNIREAGAKQWRAAAWLLEKRFPHRYGKPAEKLLRDKAARKQSLREEQARRDAPSFDSVNREYFDSRLSAVELREAALADAAEQLHGLRDDLIRRELELLAMEARARALDPAAAAPPISTTPPGATAVSAVRSSPSIIPNSGGLPPTGTRPATTPPGATAVSAVRSSPSSNPAVRTAAAAAFLFWLFHLIGQAAVPPATAAWDTPHSARLTQPPGLSRRISRPEIPAASTVKPPLGAPGLLHRCPKTSPFSRQEPRSSCPDSSRLVAFRHELKSRQRRDPSGHCLEAARLDSAAERPLECGMGASRRCSNVKAPPAERLSEKPVVGRHGCVSRAELRPHPARLTQPWRPFRTAAERPYRSKNRTHA